MGPVVVTTGSQAFMILVVIGGLFGVSRRLDMVGFGPFRSLRRAETTTVAPALLGRRTATRVILARKRNAMILDMSDRQRNANAGHGERYQSQASPELSGQPSPQLLPLRRRHS